MHNYANLCNIMPNLCNITPTVAKLMHNYANLEVEGAARRVAAGGGAEAAALRAALGTEKARRRCQLYCADEQN